MGDSDDVAAFILARLAEDEEAAQAATPGPWWVGDYVDDLGGADVYAGGRAVTSAHSEPCCAIGDATHMVRQDPKATLARVEALRALVGVLRSAANLKPEHDLARLAGALALRNVAAIWREHAEYDESWRP